MFSDRIRSILVVTPCSARKAYRPVDPPTFEDLASPERRANAWERLALQQLPACAMYTGQHHRLVVQTVDRLRRELPDHRIDLAIISAGHGVLGEHDQIIPYEATFAGLSRTEIIRRAGQLALRPILIERLAHYDLGLFLLGRGYLAALDVPLPIGVWQVYVGAVRLLESNSRYLSVRVGRPEARRFGVSPRLAQATWFARFADLVIHDGWNRALTDVVRDPSLIVGVSVVAEAAAR